MSQALQRVIVCMLYDPDLRERVYGGENLPQLTAKQMRQLRCQPRQAWRTDPYLSSRTLQGLIEEYLTSVAVTGVGHLHKFFSSTLFHECVQTRGWIAVAFGHWLRPHAGRLSVLECAIAQARRRVCPLLKKGSVAVGDGVFPMTLPMDTMHQYQGVRERLGSNALQALLSNDFEVVELPPESKAQEYWIVTTDQGGSVSVAGGTEALNGLLVRAIEPTTMQQLREVAVSLGASGKEADDILCDLEVEGLLKVR